jgi:hypothetical protein
MKIRDFDAKMACVFMLIMYVMALMIVLIIQMKISVLMGHVREIK